MNVIILVPLGFFVAIVLIVWVVFRYIANEKKNKYSLIEKAIEKGQAIPENLLEKQEQKSFGYFKNAIIFLALSTAFWAIFIYQKWSDAISVDNDFGFLFVSAFFTAFGAAWLIIGFLRRAQEKQENAEK